MINKRNLRIHSWKHLVGNRTVQFKLLKAVRHVTSLSHVTNKIHACKFKKMVSTQQRYDKSCFPRLFGLYRDVQGHLENIDLYHVNQHKKLKGLDVVGLKAKLAVRYSRPDKWCSWLSYEWKKWPGNAFFFNSSVSSISKLRVVGGSRLLKSCFICMFCLLPRRPYIKILALVNLHSLNNNTRGRLQGHSDIGNSLQTSTRLHSCSC